jgi:hypothetical protein
MKGMTVLMVALILALLVFVSFVIFIVKVRTDLIEPFKNIFAYVFVLPF